MLGGGSGAVPSGGTHLTVSHPLVCTSSFPPSTEHQGSWTQAQHRELPWEYQGGFVHQQEGEMCSSEMCSFWDLPQLLPTDCPQMGSVGEALPVPAEQQLQSCPVWFYTSDIQLVFLHTGIPTTQQQVTWKPFLSPSTQV